MEMKAIMTAYSNAIDAWMCRPSEGTWGAVNGAEVRAVEWIQGKYCSCRQQVLSLVKARSALHEDMWRDCQGADRAEKMANLLQAQPAVATFTKALVDFKVALATP